jgi:hypothetical protein
MYRPVARHTAGSPHFTFAAFIQLRNTIKARKLSFHPRLPFVAKALVGQRLATGIQPTPCESRLSEALMETVWRPLSGPDDAKVVIGTETDRGPWVGALVVAGYTVYGVNRLQASRYRERHGVRRQERPVNRTSLRYRRSQDR